MLSVWNLPAMREYKSGRLSAGVSVTASASRQLFARPPLVQLQDAQRRARVRPRRRYASPRVTASIRRVPASTLLSYAQRDQSHYRRPSAGSRAQLVRTQHRSHSVWLRSRLEPPEPRHDQECRRLSGQLQKSFAQIRRVVGHLQETTLINPRLIWMYAERSQYRLR
jgi:hypothetical protein